jgi:hypothetical protein
VSSDQEGESRTGERRGQVDKDALLIVRFILKTRLQ